MKSNSNRPSLQSENARNLLAFELLHIVQDQHKSQSWGKAQNSFMQMVLLLSPKNVVFGIFGRGQEPLQFVVVGDQFLESDSPGIDGGAAPHAPAAVPRYRVQPSGQFLRFLQFRKVVERTEQNVLHRIFGVFAVSANPHAE